MQQNRNEPRPYDQMQDPLRWNASSSTGTKSGDEESPYGFNGRPLSRPPARTGNGQVRHSRTDNSIHFPAQTGQRPQTVRSAGRGNTQSQAARQPRRQQSDTDAKGTRSAQRTRNSYKKQRLRPTGNQPVRDPVRREMRKKRKLTRAAVRRRRLLRRLAAFLLLLCVIAVGAYLTMTMLFRIQTIQVQTADGVVVEQAGGYSSQSILQMLGVQLEENIFSFEPGEKEAVLERQFPLLESIQVVREYPNTVTVRVTEAVPAYTMQAANGWLVLSEKFKIMSCEVQQPAGLTVLYGSQPQTMTPGEELALVEQEADGILDSSKDWMNILLSLRQSLSQYGLLDQVTRIEFADTEQIAFLYQDRISVLLGTLNDLDYKIERAHYVLTNQDGKGCGPTDTGRLDFSHSSAGSNRRIYFAQGEPDLPSGYIVPAPEPEPVEPAPDVAEEQPLEPASQTETEGA